MEDSEILIKTFRRDGPTNAKCSAEITHIQTGLRAFCDNFGSVHRNVSRARLKLEILVLKDERDRLQTELDLFLEPINADGFSELQRFINREEALVGPMRAEVEELLRQLYHANRAMTRPIAIIGPSGVGKTTLVRRLVQEFPDLYDEVISHTSRDIREGEVNGVDYHFTERTKLEHMIDEGMMIEHAEYGGNLYSLSKVEFDVEPKQPVVVVERHGFDQLVEHFGRDNVVGILVFPPSMKELERRLESRPERIATAREEMAVDRNFDLIVVNTHILNTINEIRNGLFRIAKFRHWNVGSY